MQIRDLHHMTMSSRSGATVRYRQDLPGSSVVDKWSFYILLLYFAMLPFNEAFHRVVLIGSYLDVTWFVVLSAFSLRYIIDGKLKVIRSFELKIVLLWMGYLWLHVLLSTLIQEDSFYVEIYQLRWLLQSLPIFILIVARGLNKKELNTLLIIIVLMTPLSILKIYYDYNVLSVAEMQVFARTERGVSYNLYVPFTTFPLFASVYLIFSVKRKILKNLIFFILASIALFIFINPSRQSVGFVILCGLFFLAKTKSIRKLLIVIALVAIGIFVIDRLNLTYTIQQRFFSKKTFETGRIDSMVRGINSIDEPVAWLFGTGLARDFGSLNPHNNYIYSVMRIGLVGTLLMFLPFFSALIKSMKMSLRYSTVPWFDRNLSTFVFICLFYPLYHSFFGYPHLDSLNSPVVWLGLAISVIYNRDLQKLALTNRRISKFDYGIDANRIR